MMGSKGPSQQAPAPPPPPPAPPKQVEAKRAVASRGTAQRAAAKAAENVRNVGGGRGLDTVSTTSRALKTLTGQ